MTGERHSIDPKVREALQGYRKKRIRGRCLFVDSQGQRCSNKSIQSHTVQNGGTLASIAEAGHVCKITLSDMLGGKPPELNFRRIGKSKASVFPGFCKRHDRELFLEIENGNRLSYKRQAVLLGYRSICWEYFNKEINIDMYSNPEIRKRVENNGGIDEFDSFFFGTVLGFNDLAVEKKKYEVCLHSNDFSECIAARFTLERPAPFCFATPFAPEYTFDGRHLLPSIEGRWSTATAFCGTVSDEHIFAISGFKSDFHDIEGFVQSAELVELAGVGDLALDLSLEYTENMFFQRSWVENLSENQKNAVVNKFFSGIPGDSGTAKSVLGNGQKLVNIAATELRFFD